jgi:hypothetical protein
LPAAPDKIKTRAVFSKDRIYLPLIKSNSIINIIVMNAIKAKIQVLPLNIPKAAPVFFTNVRSSIPSRTTTLVPEER